MSLLQRSPVVAVLRDLARTLPALPRRAVPLAVPIAAFAAVALLLSAWAARPLGDPDTFWHVHFGLSILATGRLPQVDVWSWTMAGAPWIAKEWLSQVLFALAFRAAGWSGVAILAIAALAATAAIFAGEIAGRLGAIGAAVVLYLVFPLIAGHVLARPHLLAWLPMTVWTIALLRAAEATRTPSPLHLATMTIWANLHGSFLLGLVLVPVFAVEAVLRAEPAKRASLGLAWVAFGAAAVIAALIHPYGYGALAAALDVLRLGSSTISIAEWAPTALSGFAPLEIALVGGLVVIGAFGVRLAPLRLVLVAALAHMALTHVRHVPIFALVGALVLAEPVARALGLAVVARPRFRPPAAVPVLLAVVAVAALLSVAFRSDVLPGAARRPEAALAAVRAAAVPGEVFNDYDFGGWLISEGVRTFIDGRTELFGAARTDAWTKAVSLADPAGLDRLLADPRIGWTLLEPDRPAVAWLDRSSGWKRLYADDRAVVHVRER